MIMDETNPIFRLIEKHEALRLKMYRDSQGIETIGVGHNLRDKPISKQAALCIFQDDVNDVLHGLENVDWFHALDPVRQTVVIDMCFNLGIDGLFKFVHMIEYLKAKDWTGARDAMLNSEWAKQVGIRAIEDSQIIETGTFSQS